MAGLREQKKQETREAICAAAVQLFAENSFEKTSIEDIANAAGIGKTTVYGYFANKEDIFLTYCDEELARAFARYQSSDLQDKPLLDRLVDFFMFKFAFVVENPEFGRQMMRQFMFPNQVNEKISGHDQLYLETLETIFRQARERGEIAPQHDLFLVSVHFFSLYLGCLVGWYKNYATSLEQAESLLRQLFQQALQGVLA